MVNFDSWESAENMQLYKRKTVKNGLHILQIIDSKVIEKK